ncbi:hypothetical protein COV81_03555 [Candidatus Peregrinibacteria bacterium CG11_big_fil_rev_8_21_14_0_20_41_10]|nr:MAG: hypothetical protein COV81_03555 [Candidatus Peregrinibacteria bacterium CG11_big_fil_rev_8_21_14_0_20_41_10]PIZ74963.1 MAG: hypothetical protein COY06_03405 [Candidatus Peregrinibacteria bacterium CG_4_10_14_0_2_um_filter_41_8]PJC38457.1 MAG: hypothetical protein CO045_00160 [Candidatus Peregrinibacteria bacterium CG_4_9_14_0_2_um_filter_41_14]
MDDSELYRLCQEYGSNARMWSRKFAALLPEVAKRQLYRKHGFYSIFEFAAKLAGMGRKSVEEVLRTYSKVEDKPLLKAQIEQFGWAKVRVITPLVNTVKEDKLAEMVKTLPRAALAECVQNLKEPTQSQKINPTCWELETITFKVDHKTALKLRKFQQKLEKQTKIKMPLGKVLNKLLEGVEQEVVRPKKTRESQKVTRYIPAQTKREAVDRHNGKCAFPGCNKPYQEIHHPQRFAIKKSHEDIVPLCKNHHHIAHAGLIKNEEQAPALWSVKPERDWNDYKSRVDVMVRRD